MLWQRPRNFLLAFPSSTCVLPKQRLVFKQIGQGGEVPLSYYKQQMLSVDIDNAVCASVGRGSSLQVECEVAVKNSAIR